MAVLKQQVEANVAVLSADGRTASEQLTEISKRLRPLVQQQDHLFEHTLKNLLVEQGIHLINYVDLHQEQRNYLHEYSDVSGVRLGANFWPHRE